MRKVLSGAPGVLIQIQESAKVSRGVMLEIEILEYGLQRPEWTLLFAAVDGEQCGLKIVLTDDVYLYDSVSQASITAESPISSTKSDLEMTQSLITRVQMKALYIGMRSSTVSCV
jgi:hypothetical protein